MDTTNEPQLTKKERRELRRQEHRQEQARRTHGRSFRRTIIWLSVIGALAVIGWLVWQAAQNAAPAGSAGQLAVPVGETDHIRGSTDAPITLVEYGDFQCPACASFHPIVEDLFERSEGQVRFVFRHFPLRSIHPNAQLTSQAAEAAGLQGAFWEMHDLIFTRQQEWASLSRGAAQERMVTYATELELDLERFEEDMDSDVVRDTIDADIESGEQARISSTPSFFVNGTYITGYRSLQEFEQMVLGSIIQAAPQEGDAMQSDGGTTTPTPENL